MHTCKVYIHKILYSSQVNWLADICGLCKIILQMCEQNIITLRAFINASECDKEWADWWKSGSTSSLIGKLCPEVNDLAQLHTSVPDWILPSSLFHTVCLSQKLISQYLVKLLRTWYALIFLFFIMSPLHKIHICSLQFNAIVISSGNRLVCVYSLHTEPSCTNF